MSFVPIRVSTLRGDQKIEFDAYVRINDKQILYLRKGDSFEGQRLKRLKEKKLKKMYIMANDEDSYRNYLSRNIEMAYDSGSNKSIETRAQIIQGSQQSNAEAIIENPENPEEYNRAKNESERFVHFLTNEDQALAQILAVENLDKNIAHHGVTVASLATTVAQKMGGFDAKQMQLLNLGALLHDIEHFYSHFDVARAVETFNQDESRIYRLHPADGARRVIEKKHIDQLVIQIIAHHEEHIDGSGFPQGLSENQVDPLVTIVSSANAFDRLMTFEGRTRKEAVKALTIKHVGSYPLLHIQALGDAISKL